MKNPLKTKISLNDLIGFPEETLGSQLKNYLFSNTAEPDPIAEKEDVYRVLIKKENSGREEIAMHFYLFGNGDVSLYRIIIMAGGLLFFTVNLRYFFRKFSEGRKALRFYDLNHFKMLHLPVTQIKDAFLIR